MKSKLNNSQNFQIGSVGSTPTNTFNKPSSFFNWIHKVISNIFLYDERNQINELISAIFDLKTQQQTLSKENITKPEVLKLIRICNKLLLTIVQDSTKETLEILELEKTLLSLLDGLEENSLEIQITAYNNCAVGSLIKKDPNYSQVLNNLLSSISQLANTNNPTLIGITYNNLASYFLLQKEFTEAYKYAEKGLAYMESYIFKKIHGNKGDESFKNEQFLKELVILLGSYMNFGYALRYYQNNPKIANEMNIPPKKYQTFFSNGYKLGMKYLGSKHFLTQKLGVLVKSTQSHVSAPEIITTEEENNGSFNETGLKFNKKLAFGDQELSSNQSEFESSFNENNEEFFNSNPKSFRIKSKKLPKPRPFTTRDDIHPYGLDNREISSKYLKQIKEMEETLFDIQQMREFYEREKRFIDQSKRIPIIPEGNGNYFNGNMNPMIPNPLTQTYSPHDSNGVGRWMNPVNQNMNPNMSNNFGGGPSNYYMPNFSQMPPQKNERSSRQVELEEQLQQLRKENEEMAKERELKQNEFAQLKNMIEEIRNQNSERSNNHHTKNTNNVNNNNILDQLDQPNANNKERPLLEKNSSKNILAYSQEKKKHSASPCSSSQNLDLHQNPPPNLQKSQNIEKPTNDSDSPEILQKLKDNSNAPGRYANKAERNFKLPLKNIPKEDEKPFASPRDEKKEPILKNPIGAEGPTLKKVVSNRDSKVNFHPDPTILNKSQVEENNSSAVFQKKSPQQKALVTSTRVASHEQIPQSTNHNNPPSNNKLNNPTTGGRPSNLKKSDRGSKKNSMVSSIDFINDNSNPGFLLKSLLPSFPRNMVIRKQLYLNEETFSLECQIVDESEQAFFLLQGKNETTQKALNEEKLSIHLFSKILQTVDAKDVLPYDIPIKTMESYEDFMRYCVMPFLGIGITDEQQMIEVWPKAHGLFLNLVTVQFFGEDCFMFCHYIHKDLFRVVLAHSQSGKNVRFDLQMDPGSISKIFEAKASKGGKKQLIEELFKIVQSSKETGGQMEKLSNLKQDPLLLLESFKILDLKNFVGQLENLILNLEAFLKEKPNVKTFFELIDEDQLVLLKIKIWNQFTKFRMHFLRSNDEKSSLEIFLKNGFETHAPEKKKIKAEGQTVFPFDNFWKTYGVIYKKMESNDKLLMSSIVLDTFTLETFEKELDPDDYDRFDPNPITPVPLEYCGFLRVFIGESYKTPVTITLLGLQNVPIGIRITIFDLNTKMETGIFLTVNSEYWKKDEKEKEGKKKKKYMVMTPMEENYNIAGFLKDLGFNMIYNLLIIDKKIQNYEIVAKKFMKNISLCDNFESMVSVNAVASCLKKNQK